MTLVLSCVCDSGNALAVVFDEQFTTLESAADVLSKGTRVNPSWAVLFCGDNVAQIGSIFDKTKRALLTRRRLSVSRVVTKLLDAERQTFLLEVVPSLIPPGWTYDKFTREGEDVLGASEFQRIQTALNHERTCDFLVAGFDDRGLPHIVHIPAQQPPIHCRWGYRAMGSGQEVANHYLMFSGYSRHLSVNEAVYRLCASKFFSESGYVGPSTRIAVLRKDASLWSMRWQPIRRLWNREGCPRIPTGLEKKMPSMVSGPSMQFSAARRTRLAARQAPRRSTHGP